MTKSKMAEGSASAKAAEQEPKPKATRKAAKSKRSKKAEVAETPEQLPEAVATTEPPESTPGEGPTFADMARGYLAQLEEEGRSESTINGYRAELRLAASVLGEEKSLDDLTAEEVAAFLGSDAVTHSRTGQPKSKLSTDRTARVLRQALAWAVEHGMVKQTPVPRD